MWRGGERQRERERETERDKINETASEFSKTLFVGQRRNQRDAPPPPVADKWTAEQERVAGMGGSYKPFAVLFVFILLR